MRVPYIGLKNTYLFSPPPFSKWQVNNYKKTTQAECSSLYINAKKLVIPAWTAGIQATWKYLKLPSLALDTRFPAGMTVTLILVYNDESGAL